MQYYSTFSVGEYEIAEFADSPFAPANYKPIHYDVQTGKTSSTPLSSSGVRKAHTRNVGGKMRYVGQSIMKAGKNTAGALKSGAMTAGGYASSGAGKAGSLLKAGAGKAGGYASSIPRPGIAGTAAIGAVAAGGAAGSAYLLSRRKKKRI